MHDRIPSEIMCFALGFIMHPQAYRSGVSGIHNPKAMSYVQELKP